MQQSNSPQGSPGNTATKPAMNADGSAKQAEASSPIDSKTNNLSTTNGLSSSAAQSKNAPSCLNGGALQLQEQSTTSRRPMRKSKTKEAIQRHLNNKFDQFEEQQQPSKMADKKSKKQTPQTKDVLGITGHTSTSQKNAVTRQQATATCNPLDLSNVPMGPFASSLIAQSSQQVDAAINQTENGGGNSKQTAAKAPSPKKKSVSKSKTAAAAVLNPEVAPASTTAQAAQAKKKASPPASATLKKKEEKQPAADKKKKAAAPAPPKEPAKMTRQQKKKAEQIVKEERDKVDKLMKDEAAADQKEDADMQIEEKQVENAPEAAVEYDEEMDGEGGYDESDDEESEDEVDEDEDGSSSGSDDGTDDVNALDRELRRKRKAAFKKEQQIANRALRIKMGKSGAQAATRKNIKKGKDACQRKLWNQPEDDAIVDLVARYGTKRWTFIAQQLTDEYKIGGRTGKQCRERWHNHLDPSIKKSPINDIEEGIIFDAHKIFGNKWADIAKLLNGRSDNCIKNYYYSTLRKHIRRINKSLKQCQVAKKLGLKVKNLTADILFPLVKDGKITYHQVKVIDPKKFEDLEHTMRMIFNHEDGQLVTQRGIIAAHQKRLQVEEQLREMEMKEQNLAAAEEPNESPVEKKMSGAAVKRRKPQGDQAAGSGHEPANKRQKLKDQQDASGSDPDNQENEAAGKMEDEDVTESEEMGKIESEKRTTTTPAQKHEMAAHHEISEILKPNAGAQQHTIADAKQASETQHHALERRQHVNPFTSGLDIGQGDSDQKASHSAISNASKNSSKKEKKEDISPMQQIGKHTVLANAGNISQSLFKPLSIHEADSQRKAHHGTLMLQPQHTQDSVDLGGAQKSSNYKSNKKRSKKSRKEKKKSRLSKSSMLGGDRLGHGDDAYSKRMQMFASSRGFYPPMLPFLGPYGEFPGFNDHGVGAPYMQGSMPSLTGQPNGTTPGQMMDLIVQQKSSGNGSNQAGKSQMPLGAPFGDFNKFKSKGLAGISQIPPPGHYPPLQNGTAGANGHGHPMYPFMMPNIFGQGEPQSVAAAQAHAQAWAAQASNMQQMAQLEGSANQAQTQQGSQQYPGGPMFMYSPYLPYFPFPHQQNLSSMMFLHNGQSKKKKDEVTAGGDNQPALKDQSANTKDQKSDADNTTKSKAAGKESSGATDSKEKEAEDKASALKAKEEPDKADGQTALVSVDEAKKKRAQNETSNGSRQKVSEVINIQHNQYIGPVDQISHLGHFYGPAAFNQMPPGYLPAAYSGKGSYPAHPHLPPYYHAAHMHPLAAHGYPAHPGLMHHGFYPYGPHSQPGSHGMGPHGFAQGAGHAPYSHAHTSASHAQPGQSAAKDQTSKKKMMYKFEAQQRQFELPTTPNNIKQQAFSALLNQQQAEEGGGITPRVKPSIKKDAHGSSTLFSTMSKLLQRQGDKNRQQAQLLVNKQAQSSQSSSSPPTGNAPNQTQQLSPRKLFCQKKSSDTLKPLQQLSQTSKQPAPPTGTNLQSFKQFKQRAGLCNLKDLQRKIDILNSKGVTPVNGSQVPLPSTSNFLIGGAALPVSGLSDYRAPQLTGASQVVPTTKRFQHALKGYKESALQQRMPEAALSQLPSSVAQGGSQMKLLSTTAADEAKKESTVQVLQPKILVGTPRYLHPTKKQ